MGHQGASLLGMVLGGWGRAYSTMNPVQQWGTATHLLTRTCVMYAGLCVQVQNICVCVSMVCGWGWCPCLCMCVCVCVCVCVCDNGTCHCEQKDSVQTLHMIDHSSRACSLFPGVCSRACSLFLGDRSGLEITLQ